MLTVALADAKVRSSEPVERAAAGERVCITRRGKPVAQIVGIDHPRQPVDLAALQASMAAIPSLAKATGVFIRRMDDEDSS